MYEIYGMKLGDREIDSSRILFRVDPGKIINVSYYMWCLKGQNETILVDTGMTGEDMKKRSLVNIKVPQTLLSAIGVNPADIKTIIVTHLHSDHFSAYELYPNATFWLQKTDLTFFAAADVRNSAMMKPVSDIAEVVRLNYAGRIRLLDGDEEILPGIRVFLVGGHTPGSQVVAVTTEKGTAVLCGDAVDLYRNIEENLHGGPTWDVGQMYAAYNKIKKIATSKDLILPGHEPLIMEKFPRVSDAIVKIK